MAIMLAPSIAMLVREGHHCVYTGCLTSVALTDNELFLLLYSVSQLVLL